MTRAPEVREPRPQWYDFFVTGLLGLKGGVPGGRGTPSLEKPPGGGHGGGLTPGGGFFPAAEASPSLSSSKDSACSTDCGLGMLLNAIDMGGTTICFLFSPQSKLEYLSVKDSFSMAASMGFCLMAGRNGRSHLSKWASELPKSSRYQSKIAWSMICTLAFELRGPIR